MYIYYNSVTVYEYVYTYPLRANTTLYIYMMVYVYMRVYNIVIVVIYNTHTRKITIEKGRLPRGRFRVMIRCRRAALRVYIITYVCPSGENDRGRRRRDGFEGKINKYDCIHARTTYNNTRHTLDACTVSVDVY